MGFNEALASNLRDTTSFFDGTFSAQSVTIVICCALALYNALLLLMLILMTFRHYHGLYFWSLVVASSGIIPYCLGFMIEYFQLTAQVAGLIITTLGWPMLVTGQSLVLYSRLGVVMGGEHRGVLSFVKWMIIVDGTVFHISTTGMQASNIVSFGAYLVRPGQNFSLAYRYIEKIQMTGFTIQELIISSLYIWRTLQILKVSNSDRKRTRRIMWQLFSINVVIIVLDAALLVVEYQDRHVIEQALKEVIYSVKLKFEFAILNKLAGIATHSQQGYLGPFAGYDDFLDRDGAASVETARPHDGGTSLRRMYSATCVEKSASVHGARSASAFSWPAHDKAEHVEVLPGMQAAYTADQQRRRQTLEGDLYAGACRDMID